MTEDLFLSIHARWEHELAVGTKDVEIRRRLPAHLKRGARVALYVTKPVGAVRSVAVVAGIYRGTWRNTWTTFGPDRLGMSRDVLFDYLSGAKSPGGIILRDVQPVERMSRAALMDAWPGFVVPQSYRYLPQGTVASTFRLLQEDV